MTLALAEFFTQERGVRSEILSAFGVRFHDTDTAYLPYPNGEKTRRHMDDGTRRFYFTEGKKPWLYHHPDAKPADVCFIVEGETDTMRLYQELLDAGADATVVGLSGINCWQPEMVDDPLIARASKVLVILDNDVDYMVVARVDAVWRDIRRDIGSKARRVRLPGAMKDLCEFFNGYGLDSLRERTVRPSSSQSRYRPLDLSIEPPPVEWLLDGLIAKGDVTMLLGDGGLGKSMVTKGLAIAVAEGHETFLDRAVLQHGNVLYVDEENPEDIVRQRLRRLGLTDFGNLRFLSNEGIRLDRHPEEFLEEAMDFNPALIVLDSMTRLHTEDENSSGAMARLYNDGIKPLAREVGAAVVLIHHTNKSGGARGSVDLVNSVDAGVKVSATEPPQESMMALRLFRSRRRATGETFTVAIRDKDGGVILETGVVPDPPF